MLLRHASEDEKRDKAYIIQSSGRASATRLRACSSSITNSCFEASYLNTSHVTQIELLFVEPLLSADATLSLNLNLKYVAG